MLTKEHAIAEYDFQRRLVVPDRLTSRQHAGYLLLAESMLAVYQQGKGRRRKDLHRDVHRLFESLIDCPLRRIEAFCKLLDDQATYAAQARRNASDVRRQVFRAAAEHHPLVADRDALFETTISDMQQSLEMQLGRPWHAIEDELFADVVDFHRLEAFEAYPSPRALLSRYNVAQVQAALFGAISLTIYASSDFKRILRAARLARLMHTITCVSPGNYRIELTGPASVLRETRRYGVHMARFLPALICCSDWSMEALLQTRIRDYRMMLKLSSADKLQSHLPPESKFDSSVESAFFQKWGEEPRGGWEILREARVLHAGQKTFVPDFVIRHASGREVLMEIVGFWTPEYIQHRLETLHIFQHVPIVLAIPESTAEEFNGVGTHATIVRYKTSLLVKQVLDALPHRD